MPGGSLEAEGCEIAWVAIPSLLELISADSGLSLQPVACLHDAGSGGREFQPLLQPGTDLHPAGSRLISFDWPGHGRSADSGECSLDSCAEVLHALLNQLGLARPILLGSGFGAAVAIRYAAEHPARILGIVACQPAGLMAPATVGRHTKPKFCLPRSAQDAAPQRAQRQALRLEAALAEMQPLLDKAESSLRASESSLRSELAKLRCPVLFALSRDDRRYPLKKYLAVLEPLLAKSPQHRFTVFDGSFNPIWDEPERFAQALTGFVQAQLPLALHHHAWLLTAVDWPAENTNLWKCVHPECHAEQVLPAGENPNA